MELKIKGTGILRYGIWQGNVNSILCASHAKFLFHNSLTKAVIFATVI